MRNVIAYLLLATTLVVGSWFYTCVAKNLCIDLSNNTAATPIAESEEEQPEATIIKPLDLKRAYVSIFKVEDNVVFRKSIDSIEKGADLNESIIGLAKFLKEHPDTKLTVTGAYATDEENVSSYENMGMARAHKIKEELIAQGVKENQILVNSKINAALFADGDVATSSDVVDFKFSEKYEELNETDIKNAYRSVFDLEELVTFYKNDEKVVLLAGHQKAVEHIEFYLNKNKDQQFAINMPYTSDEVNNTTQDNIGISRVNDLKNQLIANGIDADKIVVASEERSAIFAAKDVVKPGSIKFNFVFPDKSDEAKVAEMEMERALENAINKDEDEADLTEGQPSMLYGFGRSEMIVNERVVRYLDSLNKYLEDNPSKTILITGHTDNIGEITYNKRLGLERAKNGKMLMEKRQIKLDRIRIETDGEINPIADNSTKEGRKLNRRIEIDIQ